MARNNRPVLDTGDAFPALSFALSSGGHTEIPAALAGDYSIFFVYRGHW